MYILNIDLYYKNKANLLQTKNLKVSYFLNYTEIMKIYFIS